MHSKIKLFMQFYQVVWVYCYCCVRNQKYFVLFLDQNLCCGYSKEPSQWDGWDCSFEYPKHMFVLMGKKIFTISHWDGLSIMSYYIYFFRLKYKDSTMSWDHHHHNDHHHGHHHDHHHHDHHFDHHHHHHPQPAIPSSYQQPYPPTYQQPQHTTVWVFTFATLKPVLSGHSK